MNAIDEICISPTYVHFQKRAIDIIFFETQLDKHETQRIPFRWIYHAAAYAFR